MKPNGKPDRLQSNTTVTFAISKDLLKLVDEAASEEDRNRSNYIVYHLKRAVQKTKKAHADKL